MMKRIVLSGVVCVVLLLSLACNFPLLVGSTQMTPLHFETDGTRVAFSGTYSCESVDPVTIDVDADGNATLSTTGIVFVDHINCTPDPSGFKETYTITGLADPDTQDITFLGCNEGGFTASGGITYRNNWPMGSVSCTWATGDFKGEVRMTLWVPAGSKE